MKLPDDIREKIRDFPFEEKLIIEILFENTDEKTRQFKMSIEDLRRQFQVKLAMSKIMQFIPAEEIH